MADPIAEFLERAKAAEAKKIESALDEYKNNPGRLTHGPEENNLNGNYNQGKGTWDLYLIDRLSPDLVLVYASRLGAMYRKVRTTNLTSPTPKAVKDVLLRDKYAVFGASS